MNLLPFVLLKFGEKSCYNYYYICRVISVQLVDMYTELKEVVNFLAKFMRARIARRRVSYVGAFLTVLMRV